MFHMFEAKAGGGGRSVGLPDVSHAVLVGLRGGGGSASRICLTPLQSGGVCGTPAAPLSPT